GTVRVRLCVEDGCARVDVGDTGPGIAAAELPHIFDRFYRADKSRSRAIEGTGLGLAIVRSIVQAHGGSIDVESALGRGTAFVLRLPLESSSASHRISASPSLDS
ncbi:MAG: hypothetical protein KGM44_01040, partial [bacterium]|nr:hypothetical protein [bacterium]